MANVTGFCPQGGDFYVCQGKKTQFLGCCTSDPCSDGSGDCPQTSLRYTSYNADDYDAIPPEECVSTGLWYTCSAISTAFMGCCLENPCRNNGCTQGNLTAARLSDITSDAAPFMTSAAAASGDMKMLSTGAIVGIAIGASLGALILGILLFLFYRRHERRRELRRDELHQSTPGSTPGVYVPSPYQGKQNLFRCPNGPRMLEADIGSDSFPSPQFQPGVGQAYGSDKLSGGSMPNSPNRIPYEQRPASTAPSWRSGGYSAHGRAPSDYHASVSSLGSNQGGLHLMYNQQRPPHSYLNAVSEMDSVDAQRLPPTELSASPALPHRAGDHVYGPGYSKIATREDT